MDCLDSRAGCRQMGYSRFNSGDMRSVYLENSLNILIFEAQNPRILDSRSTTGLAGSGWVHLRLWRGNYTAADDAPGVSL